MLQAASTRPQLSVDFVPTALVVDDQAMMVELISVMLRRIGFETVDGALGGPEALELLRSRRYGLIVSDLNMQPMTGLELLERVRGSEPGGDTPFLMTTASLNTAYAAAARSAGVTNYLLKPFTPDLLRAKVRATLVQA